MSILRSPLGRRQLAAFILVTLVMGLLVTLFLRQINFNQVRQLALEQEQAVLRDDLAAFYAEQGSWTGVEAFLTERFPRRGPGGPPPGQRQGQGLGLGAGRGAGPLRNQFGLVDAQGRVLIPLPPTLLRGETLSDALYQSGEPIFADGEQVGALFAQLADEGLTPEQEAFLTRTNLAVLQAAGISLLVAVLLGIIFTGWLVRPLKSLQAAADKIAHGELGTQIEVDSDDELGQVAAAFNRMSASLAQANLQRRQLTADIAHDLRTPLQVIGGYIEAMRDGVLEPTSERMAMIDSEIGHLQQLVEDLHTLSRADTGELHLNLAPLSTAALLQRLRAAFAHSASQRNIQLIEEIQEDVTIQADEERLYQVLSNLVTNGLRHTPAGGTIRLRCARDGSTAVLTVSDTGSGIPEAALPHIFNRFYRADPSRHTEQGETGLGLAIAKALVESHQGTIQVSSQLERGTTFTIHLPSDPPIN